MNKIISVEDAVSKIRDGMTIMIGGFLTAGTPNRIVDALAQSGVKNLTVITNDGSYPDRGWGQLVANRQVKRIIVSHIGTNPLIIDQMNNGELEVEFSPQGTLAERIRCGGAGLGGVLTPTGLGTMVAMGKTIVQVNGHEYLLEKPLRADIALIGASEGDTSGNLVYRGTTMNFNTVMATAADTVIAGVGKLLPVGSFQPECIHTQAMFIDFIVDESTVE
jgi:acetate CoA/acetoacetate CoA-transferase alpha subunit